MSKLRIASELGGPGTGNLSPAQRNKIAENIRDLIVNVLDNAAQQAGRRVAQGNFSRDIDMRSYAKGYEEALNYLDAALTSGRDFQWRESWRERMAKLTGEETEDGTGRDSGDNHLHGDHDPSDRGPDPVAVDEDDELWEDDDIEWED